MALTCDKCFVWSVILSGLKYVQLVALILANESVILFGLRFILLNEFLYEWITLSIGLLLTPIGVTNWLLLWCNRVCDGMGASWGILLRRVTMVDDDISYKTPMLSSSPCSVTVYYVVLACKVNDLGVAIYRPVCCC